MVGIENPGYPDARNNFLLRTRHVRGLRVDEQGLVLRAALAQHASGLTPAAAHGGSALWVSAGKGIDTRALTVRLYRQGVVVEPGDVFFAGARQPRHHLRIGYSSIPVERIEAGVRVIGRELAAMARVQPGRGLRR